MSLCNARTGADLDDADERVLVDDGRLEVAPGHALHDPLDPILRLPRRFKRLQEALQVPRSLHAQPVTVRRGIHDSLVSSF